MERRGSSDPHGPVGSAHGNAGALRHVPNALSLGRLACAVAFPFTPSSWWLGLVIAAGASDWLDGVIARRLRASSWIGGLLDGLSDKAFVIVALVQLAVHDLFAWWQIPLLLARDVSVGIGVAISALRRDAAAFRHMDSRLFGKLTTLVIFVLLVVRLAWPAGETAHDVLFTLAASSSAVAGVDYFLARHQRILDRPSSG